MNKDKSIILQIIRGEALWTKLEELGVKVTFDKSNNCSVEENLSPSIVIVPSISDIAQGVYKLSQMTNVLQKWAAVLLCSLFIDFDKLQNNATGERMLEILWDLSYGEKLREDDIIFIEEIVNTKDR